MRTRCAGSVILGLAAAWLYLHAPAAAAEPADAAHPKPTKDSRPFPITVEVTPNLVVVSTVEGGRSGRKVAISGNTLPAGKNKITITIKAPKPNPPAVAVDVEPDAKGHYSFGDYAPLKSGDYTVEATAPDGRGKASAKFKAIEVKDFAAQAESALLAADQAASVATETISSRIDALPESPPKEQVTKKLAEAKRALGDMKAQSQGTADAVKGIIAAFSAHVAESMQAATSMQVATDYSASLDLARGDLDKLVDAVGQAEAETQRVRDLTAGMSQADIGCHKLAFATEIFNSISALLNLKREVLDTAIGFAKDIDANAVGNAVTNVAHGSAASGFAASEVTKNLPELTSASKLAGNAYGIMADIGGFVTSTLFGQYCEQFVGPVEAAMNAKFMTPSRLDGKPTVWWSYSFKISGRLMLYYPKNASGRSIRLKGRLEGYAHDFQTKEDALTVMFPKLMAGAIQIKSNFPPIEIGAAAAKVASQGSSPLSAYVEGSGPGLFGPNSFLIDVDGVLEKDSISILIGKPIADFTANHDVTVLILAPMSAGLGPQITWYGLPFKNAHHVFDTIADGKALKMPLKIDGSKMTAEGAFTGTAGAQKAHADYTATLKVCDPGC